MTRPEEEGWVTSTGTARNFRRRSARSSSTRSSPRWRRTSFPKERVRLAKDAVTEEAPVNTEVRKEQIDTGNLER